MWRRLLLFGAGAGICLGMGVGIGLLVNYRRQPTRVKSAVVVSMPSPTVMVTPEIKETIVKVAMVGDVMLGRKVNFNSNKRQDFTWPFHETSEWLRQADLTLGNLESPLVENCPVTTEGMVFCGDPKAMTGLVESGFDGLGLMNNHSLNHGVKGKAETRQFLAAEEMKPIEAGVVNFEVGGLTMGVFALDDTIRRISDQEWQPAVEAATASADLIMAMIHWGSEYTHTPSAWQQELGHRMVDAGVRVVVGSHPHWTQPPEVYGNGIIFYSLGNFVFDQMWSEETRLGEAVLLELRHLKGVVTGAKYQLVPVRIYDYGQPRFEGEPSEWREVEWN